MTAATTWPGCGAYACATYVFRSLLDEAMGNARKPLRSGTDSAASRSRREAALSTLESIPAPVVVVDEREHVMFVNRHVVHQFGFAAAELIGRPLSQLVPETLRGRRWQELTELLQGTRQTAIGIEASMRCKDGTSRALSIEVGLLEIEGAVLALCLLRDAPPAHGDSVDGLAEARLKEAQRIAKLGSWTWDPIGNKHWWSDELYQLLQIDPAESRPFERYIVYRSNGRLSAGSICSSWYSSSSRHLVRSDPTSSYRASRCAELP